MADIRSAREIAMEKVERLGKATDEELLKWKYIPEGERLAVRYLKQDCDLVVELNQYEDNVASYIVEGAVDESPIVARGYAIDPVQGVVDAPSIVVVVCITGTITEPAASLVERLDPLVVGVRFE